MGQILPKHRQRSVLIVGLDGSGKTTLVANLRGVQEKCLSEAQGMGMKNCRTLPTSVLQLCTYNSRDFDRNMRPERIQWQVWDMSGQGKHRPLWHLYSGQVDGIVFVIDMCDPERLSIVHKELKLLLTYKSSPSYSQIFFIFSHSFLKNQNFCNWISHLKLSCFRCERIRSRVKPVAVAFCLNKSNIASEREDVDKVLNEEEVRRGIAYDDYQGTFLNNLLFTWKLLACVYIFCLLKYPKVCVFFIYVLFFSRNRKCGAAGLALRRGSECCARHDSQTRFVAKIERDILYHDFSLYVYKPTCFLFLFLLVKI